MPHPHPAEKIKWRVVDSTAVNAVGWDTHRRLYVRFKDGKTYLYDGVPYQRAVACARAESVGSYVARKIVPRYPAVRVALAS